jgi:NTP pyrophosphatase (non-canonical NTP hydrolase)
MNFNEYKQQVLRTVAPFFSREKHWTLAALGLAGESGEVVDLLKKWLMHDHPLDQDRLKDELGDVLWYFTLMLHLLDCDIDEIMQRNVAKLQARYPNGFEQQKSIKRQEAPTPADNTPYLDSSLIPDNAPLYEIRVTIRDGGIEMASAQLDTRVNKDEAIAFAMELYSLTGPEVTFTVLPVYSRMPTTCQACGGSGGFLNNSASCPVCNGTGQQPVPISTSHCDINDVAVRLYKHIQAHRKPVYEDDDMRYDPRAALDEEILDEVRPILAEAGLLEPEPPDVPQFESDKPVLHDPGDPHCRCAGCFPFRWQPPNEEVTP